MGWVRWGAVGVGEVGGMGEVGCSRGGWVKWFGVGEVRWGG